MTEKLYENNALLQSCISKVLNCTEKEGKYLVELDKTVFFPEGGGQLSDKGTLGEAKVSYVFEKEGHIYHECDRELQTGSEVRAVLDWKVRLDRMQQHLGEHLLSYACWKMFGANNVGFHMHEDLVAIDLDKELTMEELLQAEMLTNEIIWENRPVKVSYLDSEDAAKLPMRKFNSKLKGLLRIVAVQDADICTCCGTHPPYTGMVGPVKVIRSDKHKQGVRVEFACGRRAMIDADTKNNVLLKTAASMSVKPEQVYDGVLRLKNELAAAQEIIKNKTEQLLRYTMQKALEQAQAKADGTKVIGVLTDDSKNIKPLITMAGGYADSISVILAVQQDRLSYAVTSGQAAGADCRPYIKILNDKFQGRGGGKPDCVQGGAPFCENWRALWEQAVQEILAL